MNGRTQRAENHRSIKKQLDRYGGFFTEIVNRYKNINEELTTDVIKQRFDEHFKKVTVKSDFFRVYQDFLNEKENDYTGNSISISTLKRYKCNKTLLEDFQKIIKLKLPSEILMKNCITNFLNTVLKKRSIRQILFIVMLDC